MRKKNGFTLIELMVVVSIIGILTSVGVISFSQARDKANIAKAKADLNQLRTAVLSLEANTGYSGYSVSDTPVGLLSSASCTNNPEINLSSDASGLMKNYNNVYPNWSGPYMATVPKDPWGNSYYLDTDYTCNTGVEGCKGYEGIVVRALVSWGKTGGLNDYPPNDTKDKDNVVLVLCAP